MRLCDDYRRLHAVSQIDTYPIPRINDTIDQLGGAQFITTLDLSKEYWHIPISETKTGFTTHHGLFFRMMPFGLQGAPATLQRMMDLVLQGLESTTAAYLIIYSRSWKEHLLHIQAVFSRLWSYDRTQEMSVWYA